MILDKSALSGLKALKPDDIIEINNEKLQVVTALESRKYRELTKPKEIRNEGMEYELRGEDSSSHTLFIFDTNVEYKRVGVLNGPAPLNSNPDLIFVQDVEPGKTYKYTIKRREKKEAVLRFLKGSDEIEIKFLKLP